LGENGCLSEDTAFSSPTMSRQEHIDGTTQGSHRASVLVDNKESTMLTRRWELGSHKQPQQRAGGSSV